MNPATPGCRADFIWTRVSYDVVAVIDCDLGDMSVISDADGVVRFLLRGGHVRQSDRLIYRDSGSGRWDELKHRDGRFVNFASLGAHSVKDALDRLRQP